jgi:hypothetical protein
MVGPSQVSVKQSQVKKKLFRLTLQSLTRALVSVNYAAFSEEKKIFILPPFILDNEFSEKQEQTCRHLLVTGVGYAMRRNFLVGENRNTQPETVDLSEKLCRHRYGLF